MTALRSAAVVAVLLFSSCGDLSDTELRRGEYFVGYYDDEDTKQQAERLITYMDSAKTKYTQAKLHRNHGRLLLQVEATFPNAKDAEHHRLLAGVLARTLSENAFGGEPCTVSLTSSLDGDNMHPIQGYSDDPKVDSVANLMKTLGINL
jgi:hypothetical protein